MKYPLPVHSYVDVSPIVGAERLVNCYAEQAPQNGKAPMSVRRIPGTVLHCSTVSNGRGLYRWKTQLYCVSGNTLYHVLSNGSVVSIGTISGSGLISWAETPTQLVICDAGASYTYDGTTLAQIADADFVDGAQCCSIDGYVLFRRENSGVFFASDLADATSYDALMFASAEGLSDNIVGIIADHRQAILAGEDSMEIWYNAGVSGFPFIRDPNGFIELGCRAGRSLAKIDNTVFWLASDLTVRRLDGVTPIRVSTHGVEQAIRGYTSDDAQGFCYSDGGHLFYALSFPTDLATWVYDATTQLWHERSSYGYTRWRPCAAALAYGRWYVQCYSTGKIGYLDHETYTDFGDTQRVEVTFQDTYNDGNRIIHNTFEVVVETGVGLVSGQGSDPQVTLEVSDDSGRTWRTKPTKSLGEIGEYKTRLRWISLGQSRYRRYRLSMSDPVKFVVADALLDAA